MSDLTSGQPLAILIAGGSGTGKSTIARKVARAMNVERAVSTDLLRVAMRAASTPELRPELFRESFEGDLDDVGNFMAQASVIALAANDVLTYCAAQGWSIVMEGVHLVPGLVQIPPTMRGVHVLLTIDDEELHAERFRARERETGGGRAAEVYIQNLPRIRTIHDHLVGLATEHESRIIGQGTIDSVVAGVLADVR